MGLTSETYLKIILLNLNNDTDSLWVNRDKIPELELSQAVNTGGHVATQLQVLK